MNFDSSLLSKKKDFKNRMYLFLQLQARGVQDKMVGAHSCLPQTLVFHLHLMSISFNLIFTFLPLFSLVWSLFHLVPIFFSSSNSCLLPFALSKFHLVLNFLSVTIGSVKIKVFHKSAHKQKSSSLLANIAYYPDQMEANLEQK